MLPDGDSLPNPLGQPDCLTLEDAGLPLEHHASYISRGSSIRPVTIAAATVAGEPR
jgi:hypothetical protein